MCRTRLASILAASSAFVLWPVAAYALEAGAAGAPIVLQPHQAVYDISLDTARSASGITGVDGRMVFQFTGAPCTGYTIKMRMVTQITDTEGETNIRDIRSDSWEQANGGKFRFESSQYVNDKLGDITKGVAVRGRSSGRIKVRLTEPALAEVKLPAHVLFPTQHSVALLKAALLGKHIVQAKVYDGSRKGRKIYDTTAFIGNPIPPGPHKAMEAVARLRGLNDMTAWPVSIGYFKPSSGNIMPAYQIDFLLYRNGVSRELRINYGDFSIIGHLSQLTYLKPATCK